MAENQVVDFDEITSDQKKKLTIEALLKASNFTDLTATTLDWTSSSPGLYFP